MLTEKSKKNALTVVNKQDFKVIKMEPPAASPEKIKKKHPQLSPPADKFNTRYIKARDNDPL